MILICFAPDPNHNIEKTEYTESDTIMEDKSDIASNSTVLSADNPINSPKLKDPPKEENYGNKTKKLIPIILQENMIDIEIGIITAEMDIIMIITPTETTGAITIVIQVTTMIIAMAMKELMEEKLITK